MGGDVQSVMLSPGVTVTVYHAGVGLDVLTAWHSEECQCTNDATCSCDISCDRPGWTWPR